MQILEDMEEVAALKESKGKFDSTKYRKKGMANNQNAIIKGHNLKIQGFLRFCDYNFRA